MIRPPAVAGTFYPAQAGALRAEVARHLDAARALALSAGGDGVNGVGGVGGVGGVDGGAAPPKMIVVPHAGYVYSGATAARGHGLLEPWASRIRRVVLLGPVHRVPVRGLAAPRAVQAFRTPLGDVRIDHEALAALEGWPQVVRDDRPHAPEYSLEVQLPFLQAVLGEGFGLVPLAVGDASAEEVAAVVQALWGGDETVFVVSTDLSHFHAYDEARRIDGDTAARILALEDGLDPRQACGARGLNGALRAARQRGLVPGLVHLCNSGDTAGPRDRVVGYASFALRPAGVGADDVADVGVDVGADVGAGADAPDAEAALGRALLLRARNAIAARLGLPLLDEPMHTPLQARGATFVTLHDAQHRLRGCIGRLEAVATLEADVRHNAAQAAFADPRFRPVQAAEWEGLRLEVSVLTPAEPLPPAPSQAQALQAIEPGTHGVILQWRQHRATFLPQVWEQIPAPDAFMAALKRKAGLAEDFWAPDVRLSRYRVTKHDGGPLAGVGRAPGDVVARPAAVAAPGFLSATAIATPPARALPPAPALASAPAAVPAPASASASGSGSGLARAPAPAPAPKTSASPAFPGVLSGGFAFQSAVPPR